jgi:hypothetical protein
MERSWPELSDELARKAIESLEHAWDAYSRAQITKQTLDQILRYQIDTIQGLVPYEITNILIQAREGLK